MPRQRQRRDVRQSHAPRPAVRRASTAAAEAREPRRVGRWLVRYLWVLALGLALALVGLDSTMRLQAIWKVTDLRVDLSPDLKEDSSSLTGYTANQHRLVLPVIGQDGYQWVMQTERMIAGTAGWRVRHTDADGPSGSREVEWNSFLRWEAAALAWVGTHVTAVELPREGWVGRTRDLLFGPYRPGGLPVQLALERVVPWANTLTLVVFMLTTVPFVAWRFGSVPASLLALGFAVTYPFYQFFTIGYFDHHGLAATWDLLMVSLLLAGGAGWLRADPASVTDLGPDERLLWQWLPTRAHARRWFVASAIVGGAGLWQSAASTVPAMVGIGLGALLGCGWLGRGLPATSAFRVDPTLWRTWGRVGCATSLGFYALEYFPGQLGWNLEVNHPLYAIAWLGAGNLLHGACAWIARGPRQAAPADAWRARVHIGLHVIMVALLPVTVALTSSRTFAIADPFLWSLSVDYILEIQPLSRQLASMGASEILAHISVVPLVCLPVLALLWKADLPPTSRRLWRGLLVGGLGPGLAFAHVVFAWVCGHALEQRGWVPTDSTHAMVLAHALAVVLDLLTVGLLFGVPIAVRLPELPTPSQGLLSVAVLPALLMLALAVMQSRWLGVASALALATLLAVARVCATTRGIHRHVKVIAALLLALFVVPSSTSAIVHWMQADPRMPVTQRDLAQVATRDVSYRLRQRLGSLPGVVVSGPSTTTWMTYFGGFKGLGTLYAENLAGLKVVAAIYSASTAEEALALCEKYRVTHLALFSWDGFAEEYARLSRGLRRSAPAPADAFMLRVLKGGSIPQWLRPLPYHLPPPLAAADQSLLLLEVDANQTVEEATVRLAQYLWAKDRADQALDRLRALLSHVPDYLPALVSLARVQQSGGDAAGFGQTLARIRQVLVGAAPLGFEDQVDLAVVMALAEDPVQTRVQVTAALQQADERGLRRLLPDALINLVGLMQRLQLTTEYAGVYRLALDLLPPEARAALT